MSLVQREDSEKVESIDVINNDIDDNKVIFWTKTKIALLSFIIILLLSLWFSIFYYGEHNINIDNPSKDEISIIIDDNNSIKIKAYWNWNIKLKYWVHSVKLNWKNIWDFENKITDFNAFLNPLQYIYISEYNLYAYSESDFEKYYKKLPINNIEWYDWDKIEWPFSQYTGLYIVWNWDYDLFEEYDEKVEIKNWKWYAIKEKIFRYNDFANMYNERYIYDEGSNNTKKD